ncbi:MAG: hypothetical protein R3E08_09980 [Thiotrichaceae bacterium]
MFDLLRLISTTCGTKRVRISYFVHLGESAYSVLATSSAGVRATVYANLAEHFVILMDILQTTRELSSETQPYNQYRQWNCGTILAVYMLVLH